MVWEIPLCGNEPSRHWSSDYRFYDFEEADCLEAKVSRKRVSDFKE